MQFAGSPTAQQVASALLDAGLAAQIAGDIAISGAPPINLTTPIQTGFVPVGTPVANGNSVYLQPVNVPLSTNALQSIHLRLKHAGVHVPANQAPDCVVVTAYWDLDWVTGLFGQADQFAVFAAGGLWTDIQIPARGDSVAFALNNQTGVPWSGTVDIIGTTRSIAEPIVSTPYVPAGWSNNGFTPIRRSMATPSPTPIAIPGGVNPVIAIPVRAGNLQVTLQPNAPVSAQGRYALTDETGVQFVTQLMLVGAIGAASITTLQAQVGWHPVYLRQLVPPTGPTGLSLFASWAQ